MPAGNAVGEQQPHVAGHDEGDAGRIVAGMDRQPKHLAPEGQRSIEVAAGGESHLPDGANAGHLRSPCVHSDAQRTI